MPLNQTEQNLNEESGFKFTIRRMNNAGGYNDRNVCITMEMRGVK